MQYTDLDTVTKDELLKMIEGLPGDAKIYIRTNRRSAKSALKAAEQSGTTELYLTLAGTTLSEVNGMSLVASLP